VTELYNKYDGFIRGLCVKIGAKPYELDDVSNDVYARIIVKDYLAKYDESKSSFADYLYQVVRTVVLNAIRMDGHRTWGNHYEVNEETSDYFWEHLLKVAGVEEDIYDQYLLADIEIELAKHASWGSHHGAIKDPVTGEVTLELVQKSYSNIFKWLMKDSLNKTQVAQRLGVTPGSVTQYVKKMGQIILPVLEKWEVKVDRNKTAVSKG
jgi:RNA polymerase sigma factor (sigma-70 family)